MGRYQKVYSACRQSSRRKKERMCGHKKIFQETMAENSLNFIKLISLQIQEVQ